MANITIYDLAISPVSESFITELDEQIMDGIIGGCKVKIKFNHNSLKVKKLKFKNCTAHQIKAIKAIL
ncbi:hypothetical protein [Moorena sp. SIO3I6]|uniref:hypothetical protein n=1 Tax=Moorena sp. SIO3I6 TaxID=2607831 RepID=UPI0013FA919E|nr:hypothetical protein [Moorena sp. SIO3I6]NEP29682.1 hypothetical protein [Moorena sp. SIO3I6]